MKKDKKPVGIKDIAKRAKVSIGSVDRVIHKRGKVSKEAEERILDAIEALGYKPNILARTLKSNKSYTIAVIIPRASGHNKFWEQHLLGINKAMDEVRQFGVSIQFLFFDQTDQSSFELQKQVLANGRFDGVLMVPVFQEVSQVLVEENRHLPVLLFDTELKGQNLPFIGQSAYDSGLVAAQLINYSLAAEDTVLVITIASSNDNHGHFAKRREGLTFFFKSNEIPVKIINVEVGYDSLEEKMDEFLAADKGVKAIFVTNTRVYKIARYLENLNLNIFLCGYDLVEENTQYLKDGKINFLISQRPINQAYQGIIMLYQHLILKKELDGKHFVPIDIITKYNVNFYLEQN